MSTTDYDDLAERAERGELTIKPGTIRRGVAAAAEAQRLLMDASGTDTLDDMNRIARGGPSLGEPGGESPVVRARVP